MGDTTALTAKHDPDATADTPARLGYRMPAEWEPQAAMWVAWPHQREDWPGKFAPIPWVYTAIVRHLSRVERVNIVVRNGAMTRRVADQLDAAGVDIDAVRFFRSKTDRAWLRDSAPTFVVKTADGLGTNAGLEARESSSGEGISIEGVGEDSGDGPVEGVNHLALDPVGVVGWKFNGWAKYDNYEHDRHLPRKIAEWSKVRRWVPRAGVSGGEARRVVMEGGAFDVNGQGTLLTTEECLLSEVQARNPELDRSAIERVFNDYLGAGNVVWLGCGITGDDTHGHVDDLARFVDARTVVAVVEPRRDDANHAPLSENLDRLRAAKDQDGNPFEVIELPMPRPVVFEGQRLPASYANFLIANGLVLVPTFNDPNDRVALDTLASAFPGREIVGIHCLDLVLGLGTLHCLSQQQPMAGGT
jgi:agmatine deiminase